MLLGSMTAYAADANDAPEQVSSFQWKYPKNPSFEEINQYAAEHPFDVDLPDSYDIIPDIANEEINTRIGTDTSALVDAKGKADRDKLAGSLTQETLDNALNATNFMRVHAGLQTLYIHTNDRIGGYQWRAQAGAALMAELNSVTHNVSGAAATEAGIVNGVFGWAKAGPGGSNIVAGDGVANKMVNSFMPDIGNDRTGLSHRSYILNPALSLRRGKSKRYDQLQDRQGARLCGRGLRDLLRRRPGWVVGGAVAVPQAADRNLSGARHLDDAIPGGQPLSGQSVELFHHHE